MSQTTVAKMSAKRLRIENKLRLVGINNYIVNIIIKLN